MDKTLYQFIRTLAWKSLLDAKINVLPVQITKIAKVYSIQNLINYNNSRYLNTLELSKHILNLYGLNVNNDCIRYLAVRILAPACVLHECNVNTSLEIMKLTCLPKSEAISRAIRIQKLKVRNSFYTSHLELRIKNNFSDFIKKYKNGNM